MQPRFGAVLAFVVMASCTPAKSASEECRRQNAWRRVSRSSNPNAVADALEDARCDQLEQNERVEARERKREEAAAAQEQARVNRELNQEVDARLAAIRTAPNAPELGGTMAEARALCEQQRGEFVQKGLTIGCKVGGPPIFVAVLDDDARIVRIDTYYEGADLGMLRRKTESALGPIETEDVTPEGFRAFHWRRGTVVVSMYRRGVRLTRMNAEPEASPRPPFIP